MLASLVGAALLAGAPVQVGLERLSDNLGAPLRGRRVGLVAHAASVTSDGRHAVDVLREQGALIVRVFTPEHGLRGQAAAGEGVAGGIDEPTGLPIVSLYGEKTKPTPADLEGLSALVFDLQDGGVRFYTYVSTLILCLEAAAEAGIEFVVLDRPNPQGGLRVEGPVADPPGAGSRSLLARAPGPLVHGLTAGEMARYVNLRLPKPAQLAVVRMNGWRREMTWSDTGRAWPTPSPNLRSADAAIAYPGTCLLEATNVSEGRGSEMPFLLLGSPWLDVAMLQREVKVAGFALEPARFTSRATSAAPQPKYEGRELSAVRVRVTDPHAARPYALGVTLLRVLKDRQPEFAWRDDGTSLDRLLGTKRLREAIERGDSVETILASDAAAILAYRRERAGALLYR